MKGKVIGVINYYTSKPHKFTNSEIALLTTVANEAAIAIEHTELFVKTKVIHEELETRKLIEKSKEILRQRMKLTVEEAYQKIRRESEYKKIHARDLRGDSTC